MRVSKKAPFNFQVFYDFSINIIEPWCIVGIPKEGEGRTLFVIPCLEYAFVHLHSNRIGQRLPTAMASAIIISCSTQTICSSSSTFVEGAAFFHKERS